MRTSDAVLDECFEHNDYLRAKGHLVTEVPLQPPETALTLYWKNGELATTDGRCSLVSAFGNEVVPPRGSGWALGMPIGDFRLPIDPHRKLIENPQSEIGNVRGHLLPRGGTDLIPKLTHYP